MLVNSTEMVLNSSEIAWKVHWIVFAILFMLTGCISSAFLIKAFRSAPERTRNTHVSVFTMVVILCVSRGVYLLLNPYEVGEALSNDIPVIVLRLLYALGQPSLTAGFGLIHASFLKVAKAKNYYKEPLLKTRTILLIVVLYFTFGVVSEIVTVLLPGKAGMHHMLAVSTMVAVVGCLIVTVTVTYSGLRILRTVTKNRNVLKKSFSRGSLAASREQLANAKSVAKVSRVTLAAATFCIALTVANSIVFVKMFNTMSSVHYWNSDWQFITFLTCVRLLEIAMACTLLYALSHTHFRLRKVLGLRRFTRRPRVADPPTSSSAKNGGTDKDSWKSVSSFSSVKQFLE